MKRRACLAALLTCVLAVMQIGMMAFAFSDVGEGHAWAKSAIDSFSERGIVVGREDGMFYPDAFVTREEFAKMLCLTFSLPVNSPASPSYTDVSSDRWSYAYIESSKEFIVPLEEITKQPDDASRYAPDTNVTREEIAVALVKVLGINQVGAVSYARKAYKDGADITDSLLPYVSTAARNDIIKGYDDGTFRPKQPVTRAEAVVLLDRAEKLLPERPGSTPTPTPAGATTPVPSGKPTSAPQPSAAPTPTPRPRPTPRPTPTPLPANRPDLDNAVIIVNITRAIDDNREEYYKVYYYKNGLTGDAVFAEMDVSVVGMKHSVSELACGDVILAEYNSKNHVKTIYVMYSPGTTRPPRNADADYFVKSLSVPTKAGWHIVGTYYRPRYEVYLGYINRVIRRDNSILLNLGGGTVNTGDNYEQTFIVSNFANVTKYKAFEGLEPEKRFESVSNMDIDERYIAFVCLKYGEITDVILIEYER